MDFREAWVEADGFRIRTMQAGEGPPLVHLHGGGGLHLSAAHTLLARDFRVIAFEMPGFGTSPENTRSRDIHGLAASMAAAIRALGLERVHLMGTSFGGKVALCLALGQADLVSTLVLEAPAAIRQPGNKPVAGTLEEIRRRLFAHPDRAPPLPPATPAQLAQARALVARLRGPNRDPALEARLPDLATPTLVLFGTQDSVIDPAMGRIYKALMPDAHLAFLYDAGHEAGAERPEAFAEVVTDFLQRHDAFVISRGRTVIFP